MRCAVLDHVDIGAPTAFVWDYDDRRPRLTKLHEKSKVRWTDMITGRISVEDDAIKATRLEALL